MPAIDTLFQSLRQSGRKALMPFITAGDPDLAFTADVLRELVARGSHLCELGIPYSDPIADGPVIQASYTRALEKNEFLLYYQPQIELRTKRVVGMEVLLRWLHPERGTVAPALAQPGSGDSVVFAGRLGEMHPRVHPVLHRRDCP